MIHYGNPKTSGRLRATQRLIMRKRGATGAEIQAVTGSTCVHTDIAELRDFWYCSGPSPRFKVLAAEYAGRSRTGRKIYRYRMVKA